MPISQVGLYLLLAIIVAVYIRRFLVARSVKQYSPVDASEALRDAGSALLLDVRSDAERRAGSIKGSVHIPLHELEARAEELRKHQDKEIICYCRSGNRSLHAAARLQKKGFKTANLKGGIAEWNFANLG